MWSLSLLGCAGMFLLSSKTDEMVVLHDLDESCTAGRPASRMAIAQSRGWKPVWGSCRGVAGACVYDNPCHGTLKEQQYSINYWYDAWICHYIVS
ncbi:hypothetical protein IW261DRAFT_783984 [Armillaria novae-zelandiae]|uniref:Secreted protein n=1 Tax=Armillaria novae-zelandiae TaxID=153914 RepID=A0AA39PKW0_9AGAR|nr:hypothetical protein IW261DRAFT_783984 [Armillaria novae-zelandiae]